MVSGMGAGWEKQGDGRGIVCTFGDQHRATCHCNCLVVGFYRMVERGRSEMMEKNGEMVGREYTTPHVDDDASHNPSTVWQRISRTKQPSTLMEKGFVFFFLFILMSF